LGGQLPKGKAFKITGVQVNFFFGGNLSVVNVTDDDFDYIDDVRTFAENGSLTLTIGSKEFLRQAPLGCFPPNTQLNIEQAEGGASAENQARQYNTTAGREFAIVPKLLESNQNFNLELRDLPQLPSQNDGLLVVTLNGYLARNAQ
jgi:hypothetical protein